MGQTIPRQHPAVVLRSPDNPLRALLAVAMIAVVGLTAAVVILAVDDDRDTSAGTATPVSAPSPEEGTRGVVSAQPRVTQDQAFPGLAREATGAQPERRRYDGGPEEGSRGIVSAQPRLTQDQAFPGLAREATGAQPDGRRYDGGPEEGSRGSGH
jgi:hypothetical protein